MTTEAPQVSTAKIGFAIEGGLARITIDNPAQRNAMTVAMWQQLSDLLDRVTEDNGIRAVLVTGAGKRAFCAGANIDELTAAMENPSEMRRQNALIRNVQLKLEQLPRPTLAVIRGACYGGGCGLALACDIRLADSAATFAITPAKLGVLYSLLDTRRLVNVVGAANARDMLLTGLPVSAARAQQIGLVQHLAEAPTLESKEGELVRSLLENSQYSLRWTKATLDYLTGHGGESEIDEATLRQAFDDAFSGGDFREGSAAFLERRRAQFRWPEK
ncbi:enoyl-CoA hydratase/isomerase family protein [Microbulbifer pacificus]|uniref:Enoyl-CoA hydratase-related protein n=1 Tax=Microbulbifer pacificus TaxID=407164 RepID=A0AAU0N109_9GAMM|nr:enoyl-CoA hydratase-related protein [Microbulbifer pacificus]WOX05921.1 enoyl-CoA hydratase-related protein [Microbulbifer pacificus]